MAFSTVDEARKWLEKKQVDTRCRSIDGMIDAAILTIANLSANSRQIMFKYHKFNSYLNNFSFCGIKRKVPTTFEDFKVKGNRKLFQNTKITQSHKTNSVWEEKQLRDCSTSIANCFSFVSALIQGVLILQDQYRALIQYSFSKDSDGQYDKMPTDWYCNCGVFNFKRRENCFKCSASREESEKGGEGSDEISNILTKSE